MSTPLMPELPRSLVIACMCGSGLKYEIAVEAFDKILADQLRAYGLAVWKAAIQQAAEAVPTNWCDSLLTGKEGIGQPPYHCPEIEKLLTNLRAAIRSLPLPESDMTQARGE